MSERKILVTGAKGMVGSRFAELFGEGGRLVPVDIDELNICDAGAVKHYLSGKDWEAIVHFAAFTDVNEAEKQRGDKSGACWRVNVEGTRNLAEAAGRGLLFIYISTDMVFPGSERDPGPYGENHQVEAKLSELTWYGYTKAEGENAVKEVMGKEAVILRIMYPVRASFEGKLDYFRKPLALFDEGKLYPVFTDQQISITFIDEACEAIGRVIKRGEGGVFHASSRNVTTPYEVISCLIEKLREKRGVVKGATLEEFLEKTGAEVYRYPKYGGLQVEESEKKLGMRFMTTEEIIDEIARQLQG